MNNDDYDLRPDVRRLINALRTSGMIVAGSPADRTLCSLEDYVSNPNEVSDVDSD